MDHISVRLRSFKLHLTIPMKQRTRLPKAITLIYLPRVNEAPLEINGVSIPPNQLAPIDLRRVRSTGVANESQVVYASKDRVCVGNGFDFEIYIRGEKAFKGVFRRGERWGVECEMIGCTIWAELCVVTDGGLLVRERLKRRKTRFCPKLLTILEKVDEEENAIEEMGRINDLNYKENNQKDDGEGAMKKGISWGIKVGFFVACLGVGLFVSRASFKRLVGLNIL